MEINQVKLLKDGNDGGSSLTSAWEEAQQELQQLTVELQNHKFFESRPFSIPNVPII